MLNFKRSKVSLCGVLFFVGSSFYGYVSAGEVGPRSNGREIYNKSEIIVNQGDPTLVNGRISSNYDSSKQAGDMQLNRSAKSYLEIGSSIINADCDECAQEKAFQLTGVLGEHATETIYNADNIVSFVTGSDGELLSVRDTGMGTSFRGLENFGFLGVHAGNEDLGVSLLVGAGGRLEAGQLDGLLEFGVAKKATAYFGPVSMAIRDENSRTISGDMRNISEFNVDINPSVKIQDDGSLLQKVGLGLEMREESFERTDGSKSSSTYGGVKVGFKF